MNLIVNPEILNTERLYRSIFLQWWNFEQSQISPAAFIDSNGISVDRAENRRVEDIITSLQVRFKKLNLKAVVSLTAGQCRRLNTFVFYSRSNRNLYHSSIWNSETEKQLPISKAFDLSRAVRFDYIESKLNQ